MLKGVCDVCGKPTELLTCWKCGKKVCAEHYNHSSGLCSVCEPKPTRGGGNEFIIPDSAKPTTVTPEDTKK